MLASGSDCLARICGLEAGADDCLAKPAELREVLARVKAILRRLMVSRGMEQAHHLGHGARFGDCRYDPDGRRLSSASGAPIPLTQMEQSLLAVFACHPNRALTRDELVLLAHGRGWSPLDRSLDIRISRLRHKIERDPARPEVIVTVRGVGYRYEG
jgi:DNA-binding response OmpR family regulator